MSLAHRIIPTVLCRGRELVKGRQFNSWRSVGLAAQAVEVHAMREVDEICLLDIAATAEGRGPDLSLIEELSERVFCPLAVGGGVRSLEHVRMLLRAGADKVVVGTMANAERPNLIRAIADTVGSQALCVAIDVRGATVVTHCGRWDTRMGPVEYASRVAEDGAGEILLTSIEREGTLKGYDLELVSSVARQVDVQVIAHGGCGSYAHMIEAVHAGASAVAAGAFFQFEDATPRAAASRLRAAGIEVRT